MTRLKLAELPENAQNLERHLGYKQYHDLFQRGSIKEGDSILTFSQLSSRQLVSRRYYAFDAENITPSPDSQITLKARIKLKNLDWFLDPSK